MEGSLANCKPNQGKTRGVKRWEPRLAQRLKTERLCEPQVLTASLRPASSSPYTGQPGPPYWPPLPGGISTGWAPILLAIPTCVRCWIWEPGRTQQRPGQRPQHIKGRLPSTPSALAVGFFKERERHVFLNPVLISNIFRRVVS